MLSDRDRDEVEAGILWLILLGLLVILIFSLDVVAQEKTDLRGVILNLIEEAPNHRLHDEETQTQFILTMEAIASRRVIPVALLLTVCYKESSMNPSSIGRRGEIGLMQVHGAAAKGCDLKTEFGQLDCGAKWLAYGKEKCGTWEGALTAYAIGVCKTNSITVNNIVNYRLRFWRRIR